MAFATIHRATLSLVAGAVLAEPTFGQTASRLSGRVVDKSSKQPIVAAQIFLVGSGHSVSSDSTGRFDFPGLPAGTSQLLIRATSFPDLRLLVELPAGGELVREIEIDSSVAGRSLRTLEPMRVTAPATPVNYRLIDFERRRKTGRGHYLTEEDILRSGAMSLQDAVRSLRGVTEECAGTLRCVLHMARAPAHCQPDYVVDERVNNDFGPYTPLRDIVAVEVYTGPADVPGEFAGRSAGCGVIVIWTRSGPSPSHNPG